MLLALLVLGCTSPRGGVYEVSITGVETDCARPVLEEGSWLGDVEMNLSGRTVGFFPGERCVIEGAGFGCELGGWDQAVSLAERGADLKWGAAWSAEGEWADGETAVGTVDLSVQCDGADCAAVAAPEACAVEWAWEAVWQEAGDDPGCATQLPAPPTDVVVSALGYDVDDPIQVDADPGWTPSPVVVGPTGATSPPAYVDVSAIDEKTGLYLPVGGWAAGGYTVVGAWEEPEVWAPLGAECDERSRGPIWLDAEVPFTATAYGQGTTFDAAALAGTRWHVANSPWFAGGAGMGAVPLELFVEFGAVADGRAEVRVLSDTCTVLEDVATLTPTGGLAWSRERIDAATEPEALVLYEPSFSFDFAEDGLWAAGGRVRALVDVRAADATVDVCEVGAGFGAGCVACPDDGAVKCLDVAGLGWVLEPAGVVGDEPFPWCGADFSEGGDYDFTLDVECESPGVVCALSTFGVGAPLAFLRRRRRQRT